MIETVMTYVAMGLNAVIFFRLFTFRRQGSNYRPGVSIIAAATMGLAGSSVLFFARGDAVISAEQWPLLLLLCVIAAGICRHKGNLARLLEQLAPWDERERRRQ